MTKKQMDIVIVGHVDHGKSTVIGRLLADTNSLPEGKIEQIKEFCKNHSRPFEYAFLLDALKDEQSQGITIDSARCHFKSSKRDYLIIDAPGHIEFLKNMISGATRAEAAVLVIDAQEGIQENSKRHAYILSMLGIQQIIVCINKMDLVDYDGGVFLNIKNKYSEFLKQINVSAKEFIPVSALKGDNISNSSKNMSWFKGNTILSALDSFEKQELSENKAFRMPVQDIYKFTQKGDSRRIVAGRIESGSIKIGDKVVFLPSNKRTAIKSIEEFNGSEKTKINHGYSTGFTLNEQIYVARGEVMCKDGEDPPHVSSIFKGNIFWLSNQPMQMNKEYVLKIATAKVPLKLKKIIKVINASNLSESNKDIIERHDVAECMLECKYPIALDLIDNIKGTGRFVIVDDYNISGGGIVTEIMEDPYSNVRKEVFMREQKWDSGLISLKERALRYNQVPKLILLTGITQVDKKNIARNLEKILFENGKKVYFLGIRNILRGLDADIKKEKRREHIRRLGEVTHILVDAGLIVVATASDLTEDELKLLKTITTKEGMIIVNVGKNQIDDGLIDLYLDPNEDVSKNVTKIIDLLRFKGVIFNI